MWNTFSTWEAFKLFEVGRQRGLKTGEFGEEDNQADAGRCGRKRGVQLASFRSRLSSLGIIKSLASPFFHLALTDLLSSTQSPGSDGEQASAELCAKRQGCRQNIK